MKTKKNYFLPMLAAAGLAAIVHYILKESKKEKVKTEEDDDGFTFDDYEFDDDLDKAFDEKPIQKNHVKKETYVDLKPSEKNFIVTDKNGIISDSLANTFMLQDYRIYTMNVCASNAENFCMGKFLREKSILFITYKENPDEDKEKRRVRNITVREIVKNLENKAEKEYQRAAEKGIEDDLRPVSVVNFI